MKKIKKILTISTIVSTCIVSLILIVLLFGVSIFGKFNGNVIVTFACLAIGGFFAINSMNMMYRNKVIGWLSLGLIIVSVFLIILSSWLSLGSEVYSDITISLGLLSVLFNIIVSSGLELEKNKLVWQVIVYIIVGVTDIIATLAIFGVVNLSKILALFLSMIIISFVGVIILKIFAKKTVTDQVIAEKNMIKISKEEYEILLNKAKKYDEIISKQEIK